MQAALAQLKPKSHKRQRIPYVVEQGGRMRPENAIALELFERRKYGIGNVVFVDCMRPRNPGHWRRAHAIGVLLVEHAHGFELLDAHAALKVVQLKSGIACDRYAFCGEILQVPQSLSYESMDQGIFNGIYVGFCRWIADNIWPHLTPEQVSAQADAMGGT